MNEFNFEMEPGKKKYNNRDYVENSPLISVIVPFYNSKKYIEQTIMSILNQTFPYYEILIIRFNSKIEQLTKTEIEFGPVLLKKKNDIFKSLDYYKRNLEAGINLSLLLIFIK